jgi:Response regulator containing a CheY-like receiver domain and an HTH DNA-binding domain
MQPTHQPPTRVLIVDDHALFAEALAARLAREQDLVILPIAGDVRRAVALIRTERPMVVVLDLRLGAENGLDVLDHIRDGYPDVRVVILTATSGVDAIVQAVRRGAVGWLSKTEGADLVARVVRAAARRGGWIPPDVLGEVLRRLAPENPEPATAFQRLADLTPREREVLAMHGGRAEPGRDRRLARPVRRTPCARTPRTCSPNWTCIRRSRPSHSRCVPGMRPSGSEDHPARRGSMTLPTDHLSPSLRTP